jgi:hypothetical protein|tara:strand:- start:573 stop:1145 length:573 start_codon:yes stop_codon:yes gene_type:complete
MNKSEFSEKINLDELYHRKNEIEANRIKIYQKILHRVHTKIKITSRQKIAEQYCFFIIPEFLVGIPRFDSATCTAYVIDKLIENGFHVKYTHPNMLFISWNHYIDKKQRAIYKKQYGVSINGFGEQIKNKKKPENDDIYNPNSLIIKKNTNINVKKTPEKNYKSTTAYKPTGNLIYNTSLLKTIQEEIKQ